MTLVTDTCVVTARLLIMVKQTTTFFSRDAEHMDVPNLSGKHLKSIKQSAAVSDCLLECSCSIDFYHFNILATDANKFRIFNKESLLIKLDQSEINKIIKSFLLKLFDWSICW